MMRCQIILLVLIFLKSIKANINTPNAVDKLLSLAAATYTSQGYINNLHVAHFDYSLWLGEGFSEIRGVMPAVTLPPGSIVVHVPMEMMITVSNILTTFDPEMGEAIRELVASTGKMEVGEMAVVNLWLAREMERYERVSS